MTENWHNCVIADIASPVKNALVGGPFGSNLVTRDYVESGIPVIRGQNMGERWVTGDFVFVSEVKAKQLSPNTARPGDLIFTQRGTLGQVSIVPENSFSRYIISQSQMKLTVDTRKSNPQFLYYFFKSPEQQDYISRNAIQTGVPHTNLGHLRTTPILLPPLPEQRAIAGILGALDDKIEVNRRMNVTLESIARAVFRQWFVEDDVGNWAIGKLGDFADVNWGDTNTTKSSYTEKGYPAYSAKGQDGYLSYYDFDRTGIVVSAIGANSGATWLAVGKWSCIKNTLRFWATSDEVSTEYLFYATSGNDKWPLRGSAQPFISQGDAREMKVAIPPNNLAVKFAEVVRPMIEMQKHNEEESRTLASLRDSLLPKLMRGEVRVKDVEN